MKPNWPTKKLGEITEKIKLQKAAINSWPYIEIGDIDIKNKTIIIKDKKSVEGSIIAPADSVLVSRVRPTRGAIALINKEYVVSSAFTILKAKSSETTSKFLFYWLSQSKNFIEYLQKKQKGSNYPSVREKDILNFKIPLPPSSIQRKIVERLDAIKRAQELNDKQIELAEELFQSLLHRELDQKGKNWEIKKLGDLVEFLDNQRIPLNEEERAKRKGPYPYFGATGLMDWVDNFIFDGEFVLLAEDGGPFFEKDKPIAYRVSGKCWVNNHAHVLSPKDLINVDFLGYTLMFMDVTSYLTGSTRAKLNKTQAEKIKIPLPPIETQKKIVEKLSAVQEYKKKLLEQKQKLQELFESVLNKSMKGELI